jgi:hypothetical protein
MRTKIDNYGPATDPVNTDWSAWKKQNYTQEAMDALIRQRVARSRMRRFRSVPVARRAWWVTLTGTEASREEFGRVELAARLSFDPQAFWCLSRRLAQRLVSRDRSAGGSGTLYPVEYRLCAVCGRALIGSEAFEYRRKQMRPMSTWHFPEGPMCGVECKPKKRRANGLKQ